MRFDEPGHRIVKSGQAKIGIPDGLKIFQVDGQHYTRAALVCDALRYASDMIFLSYGRLLAKLRQVSELRRKVSRDDFTSVSCGASSMIDFSNRAKSFLQVVIREKGDTMADSAFQGFLVISESVTLLRNRAQHLDRRLPWLVSRRSSALGSVSWLVVDSEDEPWQVVSHTLTPGALGVWSKSPMLNPVGLQLSSHLDHVSLSAYEVQISLTELVNSLAEVVIEFNDRCFHDYPGEFQEQADIHVFARMTALPAEGDD